MQTQPSEATRQRDQLEELVYLCVNHYVALRQATSAGLELIAEIERRKHAMPLGETEREALVNKLTERAWSRVIAENPELKQPI